jgi:hypothetical protein
MGRLRRLDWSTLWSLILRRDVGATRMCRGRHIKGIGLVENKVILRNEPGADPPQTVGKLSWLRTLRECHFQLLDSQTPMSEGQDATMGGRHPRAGLYRGRHSTKEKEGERKSTRRNASSWTSTVRYPSSKV